MSSSDGPFTERPGLRGRAVQGVVSQGLSSLSNFLLVVVIARAGTPEVFGAFSIGYATAHLVIATARAAVGDTLAVAIGPADETRRSASAALAGALVVGSVAAMTLALVGLVWPHDLVGYWLIVFAVGIPLLVGQDGVRAAAFALHRPGVALASDGIWLVLQVIGWIVLAAIGRFEPGWLVAVWLLAATVGGLMAAPFVAGRASLRAGVAWMSARRRLVVGLGTESLLSNGAPHVTVYAVGLVVGLPAAGALRGAQSLYGPVRSAVLGITAVALPEAAARWALRGWRSLLSYLRRLSLGLGAVAVVSVLLLSWLPDRAGTQLLGDTWPQAALVMPAVGITLVAMAVMTGARIGLRSVHAVRALLIVRYVATVTALGLGVGGAVWDGLLGAAYGLAVAQVAATLLAWAVLLRGGWTDGLLGDADDGGDDRGVRPR